MNSPTVVMMIKKSFMLEALEELGDVMADNNILISIQNDEEFDSMIEPISKDNIKQ